jgi:hypothetical protein
MTTAGRLGRLFLLLLTASALAQNPALTTISDTVYQADGQPAAGVLLISWPEFTTSGGQAVAAGETTTTLGANGALSVQLVPNASAIPANTVYTVVYQLSDAVRTEYWVVPASSPATLAQVRTVLGAANSASQMASQQYVENAVAGKANDSAVVHLAGSETITGVKQFSVSPSMPTPVNPGDAASKSYVDNSVQNSGSGSYVSIAGATMTGPLTLSGPPTSPGQAATKNYVDLGMASKADLVSGTVPLSELGPVATLNANGNVAQNAATATQLQAAPTQCNGAFATGVQANGNANCSVADVIEMSETAPPNGIPNYGIFWFDQTCHCPKVIDNNGQAVQLGLLNVFNYDANTLEERNLGTPQAFRIYLEWGAAQPVSAQTGSRVLMEMDCVITYYTEGTVESGVDRGRALAALDMELLGMCEPPSAPKQDYTQVPPVFLGTNIYWSEPVFAKTEGSQTVKTEGLPRETEGVRLERTVTVKVFFSPEANLP